MQIPRRCDGRVNRGERYATRTLHNVEVTCTRLFQRKSHDFIAADAEKRRAVTTASRFAWREIAHEAEEARMEFERVRCAYIEHVVSCRACEWDVLASSYLNSVEYMGYVSTISAEWLADRARNRNIPDDQPAKGDAADASLGKERALHRCEMC